MMFSLHLSSAVFFTAFYQSEEILLHDPDRVLIIIEVSPIFFRQLEDLTFKNIEAKHKKFSKYFFNSIILPQCLMNSL